MLLWRYSDATLTLLWRYSDATLTLLWRFSDATLTLLWRYSDATLTLLWRYSDATLTLLWRYFWRYSDVTLTLLWRYSDFRGICKVRQLAWKLPTLPPTSYFILLMGYTINRERGFNEWMSTPRIYQGPGHMAKLMAYAQPTGNLLPMFYFSSLYQNYQYTDFFSWVPLSFFVQNQG
jgi:hypothetical protein